MTNTDCIKLLLQTFGALSDEQIRQFMALDGLYRYWNEKINVVSRKDIDALYDHHVLHSLAIAQYMKLRLSEDYCAICRPDSEVSFLDLGTGGGFPGIPMAILFPNARFTLCDSVGKKTIVAKAVAQELGLKNVDVLNCRVEMVPQRFDFVLSRAVATVDTLMPWVEGKFERGMLLLKGGDINAEISEAVRKKLLKNGNVDSWKIDSWLSDEYYLEKYVIFIRNFCI